MKTIGIIGGMGPLATTDLYRKIILCTGAKNDRDNIPLLIDNNTRIPDRTCAILHGGESPVDEIVSSAKKLAAMGADFLLMHCNTSHYFYDEISYRVDVPIVHMINETCADMQHRDITCAALLATDGTVQTGVYDNVFANSGITLLKPDAAGQAAVMSLIYDGVKAGAETFDTTAFCTAVDNLKAQGAQVVLFGCTELPLAFSMYNIPATDVIDPTLILAKTAVSMAKNT